MKWLKELYLCNFRNFEEFSTTFAPRVNVVIGENGIGKTNLLEAIHLLSTGRSFRANDLCEVIRKGSEGFSVIALYEDYGIEQKIHLSFDGKQRFLKLNETSYRSFTPLLGLLPSIIYAPCDIALVIASPKERRRFLDMELTQSDPLYVYYLTRYHKALTQRNAAIKQRKSRSMEIWEEELIKSGSYLIHKRHTLVNNLSEHGGLEYSKLSHKGEMMTLHYAPSVESDKLTVETFQTIREKEMIMGYTMIGPHRDDFEISLEGKSAKKYASEGQKRTIIAALKLAAVNWLEASIFSIDDFGSHLDSERQKRLKQQIQWQQQCFLTMPHELDWDEPVHTIDLATEKFLNLGLAEQSP